MTNPRRIYTATIYRFEAEADLGNGQSARFCIEVTAANEQAAREMVEVLVAYPLMSLRLESVRPWTDPELN